MSRLPYSENGMGATHTPISDQKQNYGTSLISLDQFKKLPLKKYLWRENISMHWLFLVVNFPPRSRNQGDLGG